MIYLGLIQLNKNDSGSFGAAGTQAATLSNVELAQQLFLKLEKTLAEVGWGNERANSYSSEKFGTTHWGNLEPLQYMEFLKLLDGVVRQRSHSHHAE